MPFARLLGVKGKTTIHGVMLDLAMVMPAHEKQSPCWLEFTKLAKAVLYMYM